MIDREKVVRGLEHCVGEEHANCENCPYLMDVVGVGCYTRLKRDALALLKEQEWIPVTERPPKDGEDVIAWIEDEHESRMTAANYYKGVWYDCVMNCKEQRIKYWMPRPKPPKEDSDA